MERIKTLLAVWLPEPLTVATCMLKSLTTGPGRWPDGASAGDTSSVDIDRDSSHHFTLIIKEGGAMQIRRR
jgi:hypothetical protein